MVLLGKSDNWIIGFSRDDHRIVKGIFKSSNLDIVWTIWRRAGYRCIFRVKVWRVRLAASTLSVKTSKEVGGGCMEGSLCKVVVRSAFKARSSDSVVEEY